MSISHEYKPKDYIKPTKFEFLTFRIPQSTTYVENKLPSLNRAVAKYRKRRLLVILALISLISTVAQADAWPPDDLAYLLGEWEMEIPDNRGRLIMEWDGSRSAFFGFVSELSAVQAEVGFRVGEHELTIQGNSLGALLAIWKYRWGTRGVSNGFEWRTHEINSVRSTEHEIWFRDEVMGDWRIFRVKSGGAQ